MALAAHTPCLTRKNVGRVGIAYNDNQGLTPTQAPWVYFIQQVDGPKML